MASKKVKAAYPELQTIITLLCDEGEKYIQEHFAEKEGARVGIETFA